MGWAQNGLNFTSILIASIATLVAWRSYEISKKSLKLSEKLAELKQPQINFYLSDSFVKKVKGDRIFMFAITVTNPSDSENTIVNCELKIIHKREDSSLGNIVLTHDITLEDTIDLKDRSLFKIPFKINSHGAVAGIAVFKLDSEFVLGLEPEKYEILFLDSNGLESKLVTYIIKEIEYE